MTIVVLLEERKDIIREVEVDVDTIDICKLLKGKGTFIGQWPEIEVVIMKCRESCIDLIHNENVLPPPFDKTIVNGPIVLIRMDQDAEPRDFTIEEYKQFCQTLRHNIS